MGYWVYDLHHLDIDRNVLPASENSGDCIRWTVGYITQTFGLFWFFSLYNLTGYKGEAPHWTLNI